MESILKNQVTQRLVTPLCKPTFRYSVLVNPPLSQLNPFHILLQEILFNNIMSKPMSRNSFLLLGLSQ
jgi:hypothetical protein